jgi:Na+/H+ antiporter NhaA
MSSTSQPPPLSSLEQQIKTHAILCAIGFLVLLPIGVLIARLTRTFTSAWFYAHETFQLILAGPIILVGWYYGHKAADVIGDGNRSKTHRVSCQFNKFQHTAHFILQNIGVTLLLFYVGQLALGIIIHTFKTPRLFNGRRPPQNYFHAVLGLSILALAGYQVRVFNFFLCIPLSNPIRARYITDMTSSGLISQGTLTLFQDM